MIVDQHIQSVLAEAIRILFPLERDPHHLVKRHVWRDKEYVGVARQKVVSWSGWSANLSSLDPRYRVIFADVVDNVLPVAERLRLFGKRFSDAIQGLDRFIVLFVLDFPLQSLNEIEDQGFVPRPMARSAHACIVTSVDEFLAASSWHWAAQITRLVILQRLISTHRKPIDSDEVPLQNLLYKSGYLHSYIVSHGLGLQEPGKPRRSGDFGHDFHALVTNPHLNRLEPFPIGIELYTAAMGYHAETIPAYINRYGLLGMIVIAKDDPFAILRRGSIPWRLPVRKADSLLDMGSPDSIVIHHLPLGDVVLELRTLRDEMLDLLP